MLEASGRNSVSEPAIIAEGWQAHRLTKPSRLFGANGMRTGTDGRIYVAQVAGSAVSAIDPDSGEVDVISPMGGAIVGPDDLAFDEHGNFYFTEITEGRVSMLTPGGEARVIYGDLDVANPITYHQGRLIASGCREGAPLLELDRNGGAPRVILESVPSPNAFDVGPDGKLYMPVMGRNEIWRISLDGGEPEVVATDLGLPDSVKFDDDGMIVSTQVASGQVLRIDPRTGEKTVLADIGPGLDNVTFVNGRTFVSHITGSIHEILEPGKVRPLVEKGLQWPLGLAVGTAGELFVADGGFTYLLRAGEALQLEGMLFTPGFPGWVRCAAASGKNEWVVTTANGDIARWRPAAQESEMLASGYDRLMDIAVAPGGAIVFAEMPTGRVLSLESGNVSELASGLNRPMGVAIAADGSVMVSEAGAGRIVKLSGGAAKTVIDGLGQPEGIAICQGTLFIADIGAREIVSCDLAGGGRETIASHAPIGAPEGLIRKQLGGVGDMCGPMTSFTGIAAGADGTIYVSADAEGSVVALRRA